MTGFDCSVLHCWRLLERENQKGIRQVYYYSFWSVFIRKLDWHIDFFFTVSKHDFILKLYKGVHFGGDGFWYVDWQGSCALHG